MSCLRNWKLQLILFLLYIFFLFSALSCFFTCIGFQRYVCWQGGFCFCQKPLSEMSNVSSSINCTQFIKYLRGLKESSCALNATHLEAISNTRHVCRRHSWHMFESVCSWWAHLRPPTTQERYWVENCVCVCVGGRILQCIKVGCSLFIFIWSEMMMKLLLVLSPHPRPLLPPVCRLLKDFTNHRKED